MLFRVGGDVISYYYNTYYEHYGEDEVFYYQDNRCSTRTLKLLKQLEESKKINGGLLSFINVKLINVRVASQKDMVGFFLCQGLWRLFSYRLMERHLTTKSENQGSIPYERDGGGKETFYDGMSEWLRRQT